jgi:hypothetical protein
MSRFRTVMIQLQVLVASCALCAGLSAQIIMTQIAEIDVSNAITGIGNNPSAVAWNGTDLYVAGFNGLGTTQQVAINVLPAALSVGPVWGVPFGVQSATPSQRGYINLDFDVPTGWIVAGYDAGAAVPEGITCWDSFGTQLWAKNARGSSGVAFDPGYPGGNPLLGYGIGWANFGQPGRALQDTLGGDVWTLATGMDITVGGQGTNFRDMDFDSRTGNVYLRASNNVFRAVRTGDNTCVTTLLVDTPEAGGINLQNICYVDHQNGEFILWNDRQSGSTTQLWQQVIQAVRADGTPETIDWGTFAPAASAGAYDFSFDRQTGTLAVVDYYLRKVEIFLVTPNPTWKYGQGCPGQGAFVPELHGSGTMSGVTGGSVVYDLTNAAPLSIAVFLFGFDQAALPFGNGCDILVTPLLATLGPVITGPGAAGSGVGSVTMTLPGGYPGLGITAQVVELESSLTSAIVFSNGVQLIIP